MHHYECVAPYVNTILQSGRFWATSIASYTLRERFTDFSMDNMDQFNYFFLGFHRWTPEEDGTVAALYKLGTPDKMLWLSKISLKYVVNTC